MNITNSINEIINLISNTNIEYNEFILFLQKNNVPLRKNQNKQIKTLIKSNNLKQRYKIENGFCLLKKYERIVLRKDKKINTYMSFLYIVCSLENNKIIKKLEK